MRNDARPLRVHGLDGLDETGKPGDDRCERGDRGELVDDHRKCAEQLAESHRRLGDDTELDFASDEPWRDQENRDDLDQVVVAGREEAEIAVDRMTRRKLSASSSMRLCKRSVSRPSLRVSAMASAFSPTWMRLARKSASRAD